MSSNDLEVYVYRGSKGEKVPETVEKLIVNEGVEELADELCQQCDNLQEVTLPNGLIKIGNSAFGWCNILEICIRSTVKFIGNGAFQSCGLLTKVEFDSSTSSPQKLETIDQEAFRLCSSLQRVKLPSSVSSVEMGVFEDCSYLVEANLSTTGVAEIFDRTFYECTSLQTVSLPNTLKRIHDYPFSGCSELVTVVVPLGSQAIRIGNESFRDCSELSNLCLPKGSTAKGNAFTGCTLLNGHYGEDSSLIVTGLVGRFEKLSIHRMCYDHCGTTIQELQQRIAKQPEEISLVDEFGMTPFHILFSTIEPSIDLLEVLLDQCPYQILTCKNTNGKRPLDYLLNNWTDGTSRLVQSTLQKSMIDPLARRGVVSWVETIDNKVQEILLEEDNEQKEDLYNEACSAFEHFENVESTSILEMALWKAKLKSGWTNVGTKRQALDREECRFLSGSDVVIPTITTFLGISRTS